MPADPIIEQIAQDIVACIDRIDAGDAYDYTLIVKRPSPAIGDKVENNLALVIQGNPSRQGDEDGSEASEYSTQWICPFTILCTVILPEASETPIEQALNRRWADVAKILVANEAYRRGGLAINTTIADPIYDNLSAEAHEGRVQVNINVRFETQLYDPFSQ